MKSRKHHPAGWLLAGAAAVLFAAAPAVAANSGPQAANEADAANATAGVGARVTDRIGDHFVTFAGSEENADALVTGLHDGTAVSLTTTVSGQTRTTTFTPTGGAMSYRNVFLSLALAEAQLTKLGVADPTPAQIQAALVGGSVTTGAGSTATTTQLTGVLVLRGQSQNWTQIAQSLGVGLHTAVTLARAATDSAEAAEAGQVEESARTEGSARATDRLSDRFATFAGGEANAAALVTGLRNGTAVTLTTTADDQTTTTTFTPAAGAMGFGNVYLALFLAQQDLTRAGITDPTPAEIEAALDGGSVTSGTGSAAVTTSLTGVLVLRSRGQGWGQVAQALGVSLHPGMDADDAAQKMAAAKAAMAVNAVAAEDEHAESAPADVAAFEHADSARVAASAVMHPEVPMAASVHVPEVSTMRPVVPQMPHFERPEIPTRPEIPGRH